MEVLCCLKNLKARISNNDIIGRQKIIEDFVSVSATFMDELSAFTEDRSKNNENFRFWVQFLQMMQIVRDLLRADSEGIWELHLNDVQRALYSFAAFDSINYLRWGSLYLEDIRQLPKSAPSIYQHFSQGNFSIKDKPGHFTTVGGDQKLE